MADSDDMKDRIRSRIKLCMTAIVYRQGRISQGEGGQVLGQDAEGGGLLRHQRLHRLGHQAAGDSSS